MIKHWKLLLAVGLIAAMLNVGAWNSAYAEGNSNKRCQNVHGVFVDCSETKEQKR
jgi:hypothetical protein